MKTEQFLKHFHKDGYKIEITQNKNKRVLYKDIDRQQEHYFVGLTTKDFNPSGNKRASDKDIVLKNYFYIDLDVRKDQSQETIITDEEMKEWLEGALKKINADPLYSQYSFITFTGNGYHIFYVGGFQEVNKDVYSHAISKYIEDFVERFGINADKSPKNIARISRLPGTPNYKRKNEYGLEPKLCEVIYADPKTSELVNNITEVGEKIKKQEEERQAKSRYEREQKATKQGLSKEKNNVYEAICDIELIHIIEKELGFEYKNGNFYSTRKREPEGIVYHEDNNTVWHGGCSAWTEGEQGKTYNTFTFVKTQKGLNTKETFDWFIDNYSHIAELENENKKQFIKEFKKKNDREPTKEEIQATVKDNFQVITYLEKLEKAKQELMDTNPDEVMKRGREQRDNALGGIYGGKIYTIGADTGIGKSTFINQICNNVSKQGYKIMKYSLEDRMEDIGKEEIYYMCNRLRYKQGKNKYERVKFLNNEYNDVEFRKCVEEAIKILSQNNIYELEKNKQVNIDELVELMEEQAKNGVRLFAIDHLHYFEMSGGKRHDLEIQNIMHKINEIARKYNIAVFLVAHYRKRNKQYETNVDYDLFKDGSAIKQVSNYIIQLNRDEYTNITEFCLTKIRGPIKQMTFESSFCIDTYEYAFDKTEKQKEHESKFTI